MRAAAGLLAALLLPLSAVPYVTGYSGSDDGAFGRYLEADARPLDPSARVQFGRGALPSDFPPGLPAPAHATRIGWSRTTSDTALSWQITYEAPGAVDDVVGSFLTALSAAGWQVTDRATEHGFVSLNVTGSSRSAGRSGVIAVGPATRSGRVQVIEEVGADRSTAGSGSDRQR